VVARVDDSRHSRPCDKPSLSGSVVPRGWAAATTQGVRGVGMSGRCSSRVPLPCCVMCLLLQVTVGCCCELPRLQLVLLMALWVAARLTILLLMRTRL